MSGTSSLRLVLIRLRYAACLHASLQKSRWEWPGAGGKGQRQRRQMRFGMLATVTLLGTERNRRQGGAGLKLGESIERAPQRMRGTKLL